MIRQTLAAAAAFGALSLAGCSGNGMGDGALLPPPGASAPAAPSTPAAPAVPTGAALGGLLGGPVGAALSDADRQAA